MIAGLAYALAMAVDLPSGYIDLVREIGVVAALIWYLWYTTTKSHSKTAELASTMSQVLSSNAQAVAELQSLRQDIAQICAVSDGHHTYNEPNKPE